MHKDQAEGVGKQVKGDLKDAAGALTGDERPRDEGTADRIEGKTQKAVGDIKEGVRDLLKK